MNIKKSRIIQIIKEEVQKMSEVEVIPLSDIDAMEALESRYQKDKGIAKEHATCEDLLKYAAEQLQTLRREINPASPTPSSAEKTQIGNTGYIDRMAGN
tara:strand:- start:577 stop:873 length:297 start_codon:yes stop_codon:yes gene_type:complete